jgi:hypothetical protein
MQCDDSHPGDGSCCCLTAMCWLCSTSLGNQRGGNLTDKRTRPMKLHNVPLEQVAWNPFRDMKVYPIDADHVKELQKSIRDHGFFGGIKGRLHNGTVELACGHHRIAAARRERLETAPIFLDDMTDDQMIELMVDENATQAGYSGAAILADVVAVMRRLVAILLDQSGDFAPLGAKCFEGKKGFETARGKLLARLDDPDKDGGLGWLVILRYLGQGDETRSSRSKRQIVEAITTLKQSGRYDEVVDDEIRKHPLPIDKAAKPTKTDVKTTKPKTRRPIYDDRASSIFPNESQAKAFREAVTTNAAQRLIPITEQVGIAKQIMGATHSQFEKKHAGAPYIKRQVQAKVEEAAKEQREIDHEEREKYLAEQREAQIDDVLYNANAALRGLLSMLAKMSTLARQFPDHPKLGGFSARLDRLRDAIDQFSKQLSH